MGALLVVLRCSVSDDIGCIVILSYRVLWCPCSFCSSLAVEVSLFGYKQQRIEPFSVQPKSKVQMNPASRGVIAETLWSRDPHIFFLGCLEGKVLDQAPLVSF